MSRQLYRSHQTNFKSEPPLRRRGNEAMWKKSLGLSENVPNSSLAPYHFCGTSVQYWGLIIAKPMTFLECSPGAQSSWTFIYCTLVRGSWKCCGLEWESECSCVTHFIAHFCSSSCILISIFTLSSVDHPNPWKKEKMSIDDSDCVMVWMESLPNVQPDVTHTICSVVFLWRIKYFNSVTHKSFRSIFVLFAEQQFSGKVISLLKSFGEVVMHLLGCTIKKIINVIAQWKN